MVQADRLFSQAMPPLATDSTSESQSSSGLVLGSSGIDILHKKVIRRGAKNPSWN
jgi:hypothetical protein